MSKKTIIKAEDFAQWMVDQVPRFDEMIMESIRPTDSWLFNVSYRTKDFDPNWFETREKVRQIAEGYAFKPSRAPKPISMGSPANLTVDRLRSVWPNVTE